MIYCVAPVYYNCGDFNPENPDTHTEDVDEAVKLAREWAKAGKYDVRVYKLVETHYIKAPSAASR